MATRKRAKPVKRRRLEASEARALILGAAERLLAARGPDGVHVKTVATAVGLTDAAVHHHFKSREGLLAELLKHAARSLKAEVRRAVEHFGEGEPDLARVGELFSKWYDHRGYARLALWTSLSGWKDRGSGMLTELVDGLHRARTRAAERAGGSAPELASTRYVVALFHTLVTAEPLFGDAVRRSVGLVERNAEHDFRRWVFAVLERLLLESDGEQMADAPGSRHDAVVDAPAIAVTAPLSRESMRDILRARGAGDVPHPGGVLLAHLERTARRLESWGARPALVVAGLFHGIYGTDGFPTSLTLPTERETVIEWIGTEAESIVYAYGSADRRVTSLGDRGSARLVDRFQGVAFVPSARLLRDMVELTLANELDVLEHDASLDDSKKASLVEYLRAIAPRATPAASSAVERLARSSGHVSSDGRSRSGAASRAASRGANRTSTTRAPSGAHGSDAIGAPLKIRDARALDEQWSFRDEGTGETAIVFVHGGARPELTWSRQIALAADFRVLVPWRRGFGPSTTPGVQNFEHDAHDLLRFMPDGAHVVAHSYGGVGAVLAASWAPERFASLTVVEAPLFHVLANDDEVRRLSLFVRRFAAGDLDVRAEFLARASLPEGHSETRAVVRTGLGHRDPGEARPDLTAIAAARLPVTVVSGDHTPVIERLSDALAAGVGAERWVLRGHGHAPQHAETFNERLVAFVRGARAPA